MILLFQIRLIREAAEWGPRYKFWSCADVDIVKVRLNISRTYTLGKQYLKIQNVDNRDQCGDQGDYDESSGQCTCDRFRYHLKLRHNIYDNFLLSCFRYGDKCNFSDECNTDEHCNNNGKCIQEDSTTIPRYIDKDFTRANCISQTSFTESQRNATVRLGFTEETVICNPKSRKKYHLYHHTNHLL